MPGQIRTRPPTAQSQMRPSTLNSRPITGQNVGGPAPRGVGMPGMARPHGGMGQPGTRPAGYPGRGQGMAGQPGRPMQQVSTYLQFLVEASSLTMQDFTSSTQ